MLACTTNVLGVQGGSSGRGSSNPNPKSHVRGLWELHPVIDLRPTGP